MNDPVAVASAWSQLQQAWAWRWFFIVAIGAAPQAWCWLKQHDVTRHPWCELRRCCALVSLLLTLWSLRLFVDTWQLDARDPNALAEVACTVQTVPTKQYERLTCREGQRYWLTVAPEAELAPGRRVVLTVLPVTGTLVRVKQPVH